MTGTELTERIAAINLLNDFDLIWSWTGNGEVPGVEVLENEDLHVLCAGTMLSIDGKLTASLSQWDLLDPRVLI